MKNTLLFTYSANILVRANRKFEGLPCPKKSGNVGPHSSNSIRKMLPHHSHSSCENATPSSGTFPLASYKEVPPPPDRTPTRNLRFGLFHQSNGSCQYLFSIPATCKIYWQKGKTAVQQSWKVTYCRRIGAISSIHDVKSEFPLSIYNHFRYSTADRMNPTASYIFVLFRPLLIKFSCRKLPTILLSFLTAVSSTAN